MQWNGLYWVWSNPMSSGYFQWPNSKGQTANESVWDQWSKVISSASLCTLQVYSWLFCSVSDTCHVILECLQKGNIARGMTHLHIEVFFSSSTQSSPDRSHLPSLIYRFLQSSSLPPMNNSNTVSRCELADVITTTPVSSVFTREVQPQSQKTWDTV